MFRKKNDTNWGWWIVERIFCFRSREGRRSLSYLPFNKSATERHPPLSSELKRWLSRVANFEFSSPEGWFDTVFNHKDSDGRFDAHTKSWIQTPSSCIAQVVVEQLCEAKHLFPTTSHIFVCPAVMIAYWRKILGKISDTMFTIKAGTCLWSTDMFEPLTISFLKPLLSKSLRTLE